MNTTPLRQAIRRVGAYIRQDKGGAFGEEGAGYYDDLYSSTDAYQVPYRQSHYYFLWSVIADRLRRAGVERVLEIGCGPGQLAAFLIDQGVKHYVGLDFSPKAVAMARDNAPLGRFVVGDACSPEIHDELDYEVVLCTEVLEHIECDLTVVSRFRPGKRCLCSVPNFPYAGHVRHFRDAGEVAARYGPFFHGLDVMTFKSPRSAADEFFLFDGVRNDHVDGEPTS